MGSNRNARRPRERTARRTDGLPGLVAFYAPSLGYSMIAGYAQRARGRPFHIVAFGTIETLARREDLPVVLDARAIVGAPERIVRQDGRERCALTVRLRCGRTERVGLDAPRSQVEETLRKVLG